MSVDLDLTAISGALLLFPPLAVFKGRHHLLQSALALWVETPSSLHCLYTSRYKDWISFLLVWGPVSLMADTFASRSSFGNSCWWPQQTIHSASFHPWSHSMSEHFIEHHEVVGTICLPLGLSLKEQLNVHYPLWPLRLTSPPWLPTLWQLEPCPF